MEEKPFKASAKSVSPRDAGKSGFKSDIRNLWTKATLSQPTLNIPLANVYGVSDQEDSSEDGKAGQWYKQQKTDVGSASERWSERNTEGSVRQEELHAYTLELEQSLRDSQRCDVEGAEDFGKMDLASSVSSVNIMKHTHHRAYWAEQQNRLPLPLLELMENEALEILTKALQILLRTPAPSLSGAQDLKQIRQGPAPWRSKVPLELLSTKSPVLPPSTRVAPAAGEVRPPLTALSGAPSSRLPVGDRQGPLPDQAAAAIHRGSQEAAEPEATRLRALRVTGQPQPGPGPARRPTPDPIHVEFEP